VRDVRKFIAVGSCEEVRYQIHLATALGYVPVETARGLDAGYEEVKKMLSGLIARVTGRSVKL
jgi:four helix bundle protein